MEAKKELNSWREIFFDLKISIEWAAGFFSIVLYRSHGLSRPMKNEIEVADILCILLQMNVIYYRLLLRKTYNISCRVISDNGNNVAGVISASDHILNAEHFLASTVIYSPLKCLIEYCKLHKKQQQKKTFFWVSNKSRETFYSKEK